MIPEFAYVMLACARIGAIHSITRRFSAVDSWQVQDCESEFVITADESQKTPKRYYGQALLSCPNVKKCLIIKRTEKINLIPERDFLLDDLIKDVDDNCEPETMSAEDPLFILYTSGSTGKLKGVMHTGGYIVYASMTHEYIFNYQAEDIYYATNIGWITGHSYIIYGPLSNGATTLMFEGVPNYLIFQDFGKLLINIK